MNTSTVIQPFNGLNSRELSLVAPSGYTGINWHRINLHRLDYFRPRPKALPSAPALDADHQAVPDSLEEWFASRQTVEIGSSLPATGSKPVTHA